MRYEVTDAINDGLAASFRVGKIHNYDEYTGRLSALGKDFKTARVSHNEITILNGDVRLRLIQEWK